jgi:uncharacterized hydrophobic protein (TIGR00341 family)
MELCLIKVFLPLTEEQNIRQLLDSYSWLETDALYKSEHQLSIDIVLNKEQIDEVVGDLKQQFDRLEDWQLLILPVESAPVEVDEPASESSDLGEDKRISRQEIYTQISESVRLCSTEIALVILSTVIAAIGLLQGSQVVIIGAMVIAPLLKPNMALGVATTLGDLSLAIRTIKVGLTEILLALSLSILLGIFVPVDLGISEIYSRTSVNFSDIILAFASGIAGAISITVGEQSAVVGVMVSVALLPPLVVLGMLIGSGLWGLAIETAVLVSTNIVCLNLAAIATFWIRDIRPQQWMQKFQASKITGVATVFWLIILVLLIGAIFMFESNEAQASSIFSTEVIQPNKIQVNL